MRALLGLLRCYRRFWLWALAGILLSYAATAANIALMAISGWFIAAMGLAGAAGTSLNYFTPAALIRATALTRTGGRYLERLVTHEATFRLIAEIRRHVYQTLESQAPAGLERLHSGDLFGRLRGDVEQIEQVYLRALIPAVVAILIGFTVVLVVASYAPGIALGIGLLFLLLGLGVSWGSGQAGHHPAAAAQEERRALHRAHLDGTRGAAELLVLGAADRHRIHADRLGQRLIGHQARLSRIGGLADGAMLLGGHLAVILVLVGAVPLVRAAQLPPADLALLLLLVLAAFEALAPLPRAASHVAGAVRVLTRLDALARAPKPVTEPTQPQPVPAAPTLDLAGVSLAYDDDPDPAADGAAGQKKTAQRPPALSGVDLVLAPTQHVALVGASGAGKSSLLALLVRFRMPSRGAYRVDGQPAALFDPEELRCLFSVAEQQPRLFAASLRDNLRLAAPEAEDAALWAACRTAQLDGFVAGLPAGLDTPIGEGGAALSGGERRRLAVARALLKPAPFLILDEPSEGLDPLTERVLLAGIIRERRGQGLILITHRPTLLEAMDRVVFLDQGTVVAQAAHTTLLADCPAYRHHFQFF